MAGVESVLRKLFEGRRRRWSIIIVNALLALALGLPAADEYFAQRQRKVELSAELAQAEHQIQSSTMLRERVKAVARQLSEMEQRALSDGNAQAYRQSLVGLIRMSGCQLRKLNLEKPQTRPWLPGEDPLSDAKLSKKQRMEAEKSGYKLRTQTAFVSISGSLEDVQTFISRLQTEGKLMYVNQLAIRPNGRDRSNIVVEIQYQLFGLEKAGTSIPSA